jgi:glyoxylase-like metal-dependent hydrolase (beta-lactamase superfamily II)
VRLFGWQNSASDTFFKVVFTPGHTPDSAAYWFPGEKRFFIGDTLYPFTAVHVDCLGSNPADFFNTVNKLKEFVLKKEKELSGIVSAALPPDDVPAPSALPASVSPASRYKAEIETFLSVLGLNRKDVRLLSADVCLCWI